MHTRNTAPPDTHVTYCERHFIANAASPDKLESAYVKSPFVAQIFIYGSSLKASLVAVVVPDPGILLPWAKEKAIDVRPHTHAHGTHGTHTLSFCALCMVACGECTG
jgi:hypothetical protein